MKRYFILVAFCWCASLRAQDSCFNKRLIDISEMWSDSADVREKKIEEYVNSTIGCTAPSFEDTTITDELINSEKLKGKVVVLNFWFTACKPCVAEFPSLNKLAKEFSAQDVVFISIALDTKEKIESFLLTHPLEYKVIAEGRELAQRFRILPYPTNLILNRDFKVAAVLQGGVPVDNEMENYDKLKPLILSALK